jgi:Ca-activated chloride channel family protein
VKTIAKIFALLVFLPVVAQDPTFSSTSNLVLLDVSVKNSKGGYAAGIAKDSFRVYEGGQLQTITHFSREDVPVTVGLVVDTSGSMGPKYQQVVAAALAFIAASNPKDEIFVVNFNDSVTEGLPPELPFTDDIGKLRAALFVAKPEGRTALYDAIAVALSHLEKGKRDKKTLILISDGGDNHSSHTLDDVKRMVQESRATIYTIGLFDDDDKDQNPRVLRQLSGVSGGETYLPKDVSEVLEICRRVASDIRARYTIGYVPAGNEAPGSLRKIRVAASQPDGQKLIVRTRTSYLVP